MSKVTFCGWEVEYDGDHYLGAGKEAKSGRLYTMYHGTSVQVARQIIQNGFKQSADGMLGPGVYVSRDQKKAQRYPLNNHVSDKVVLKLQVDIGKVKRIDKDHHPMQKTWHSQGYDTAWVPPNCGMKAVPSGLEEDCIWDPNRVKVSDIAVAPNTTILADLRQLISQRSNQSTNQPSGQGACILCKRTNDPAHAVQSCWGCGQKICILMAKHVCLVKP
ncbi:grass carp reovirus (GCRV)-induced gene 2p [Sardina pilchardus]|uniref:grass carp reovirus (GCRV)-induced gene 2p n=1 Tax=Sardina pilchardus TaxID=27697 RepID=UPI002E1247CD